MPDIKLTNKDKCLPSFEYSIGLFGTVDKLNYKMYYAQKSQIQELYYIHLYIAII